MNRKPFSALASVVLAFLLVGCSLGNAATESSNTPAVDIQVNNNPPPINALEIQATSSITDTYGGYYVFGEVKNNSSMPITSIELSIQITDASGASLLKNEKGDTISSVIFYPLLNTLDSGESTPFVYYFGPVGTLPAAHMVTVANYAAGEVDRGQLEIQNGNIVEDGYGNYYLTGELVNLGDQWMHINSLAGGVVDSEGTVLSAAWTGTYATELAPAGDPGLRDRTPLAVSFPLPSETYAQWTFWWDANITTGVIEYSLSAAVTNSYFDEYGDAHLVGTITNNSDKILTTLLVGGLFGAQGGVLDAGYAFLPVPAAPGESVPFDISYFSNVNNSEAQAALVSSYTIQLDPWNTYEPFTSTVKITSSDETVQRNGSTWLVAGNATNNSDKNLTGATVLVSVRDGSGNLIAFGYSYISPQSDMFAPGAIAGYEINIYLPTGVDTSAYSTSTTVIGDILE